MNTKSEGTSPTPVHPLSSETLRLEISHLGPVPSLKNHKRSVVQRNGQAKPITEKWVKEWMENATRAFVCQLFFAFRTYAVETRTGVSRPSWIASSVPADDCWTCLVEFQVRSELCEFGKEGATITIEPL